MDPNAIPHQSPFFPPVSDAKIQEIRISAALRGIKLGDATGPRYGETTRVSFDLGDETDVMALAALAQEVGATQALVTNNYDFAVLVLIFA